MNINVDLSDDDLSSAMSTEPLLAHDLVPEALPASGKGPAEQQVHLFFGGGGGAELGGGCCEVALPVLAVEHRAVTLTPVGCCRGEPVVIPGVRPG